MDHDDFYDKLPFTLTEEQTTPEYVIFGTGLQECLIAAYKSKSESKTGLIIDAEKTYGSSLKTVTLKEFHQLATQVSRERMYSFFPEGEQAGQNKEYFDWCVANNKHRGFNIDIEPNFFFASSLTCECLKDADMDKYMDFHLVNNILHLHDGKFRPVPLSKGKIFESK
jgi:RAB protein geranylgeranyltransferase component A